MPELLKRAFVEVSQLPRREQDAFAIWILEELASERRWAEIFARSEDMLAQLADEALVEHRKGRTRVLDPDKL
jgi:hypothetical protein